jgi:hypothetical protein
MVFKLAESAKITLETRAKKSANVAFNISMNP